MTSLLESLGIPKRLHAFEATHQAAKARLDAVQPASYARTRNALDGAVTGLSPYFTHGLISVRDAARAIHARHALDFDDKLVFEFGWREFFQHVWGHQKNPDAILKDMHGAAPWHRQYANTLPRDIREGCTGVAAIDNAVRILYATGYLHNHLRMYLASYVVHVRKVHWRAGADWLYGHLLDGDLPSNHLSWQWVAGTFSSKPYLFNAENVLKYAPSGARHAWDCRGTVIDQSYEALDVMARSQADAGSEPGEHDRVAEPPLLSHLYSSNTPAAQSIRAQAAIDNIANGKLELVHPWHLSQRPATDSLRIGVIHLPAHADWLWSERRWQFVLDAMAAVTDAIWMGDLSALDTSAAGSVTAQATLFPGYRQALTKMAGPHLTLTPAACLLPNPAMACRSFSKFYERARRDAGSFTDLLSS